jgi:hypothetical protein
MWIDVPTIIINILVFINSSDETYPNLNMTCWGDDKS